MPLVSLPARAADMGDRRATWTAYGLAVIAALSALGGRWLLNDVLGSHYLYALPLLAVLLSAAMGGLGPAIVALAITTVGVAYLWLAPRYSLTVREPIDLLGLLLYVIVSLSIAWVASRLRSAEARVRRSRRELADFFDNASIGLRWDGPDGIILRANDAELEMLGYARHEYVGRHIGEFHVDRAAIEDILRRLHAGQVIEGQRAQMRCRDGSIKNVQIDANALFEDGRLVHTRCFTRDITQRVAALEAAQRSEERLQLALVAGHMGTWDWDIVSNKITWSPGLEQIHGLAPGSFDGTFEAFQRDIHPDDRERVLKSVQNTLHNGDEYLVEYRLNRSDGSECWVEGRGMLILDSAGKPVRMVGVCMDVTERKRAAEKVRQSEHRFAQFTQHVPGLAWIKDLQGRYVYVNDAAAQAFGRRREELAGKTDTDVFPPETAAMFAENDHRAVRDGSVQAVESLYHPDGTIHQSLVSKFVIPGPDGAPELVGGMAVDITDRLRMEQTLRDSDRRKDEFLAILAHELRNPLAPIHAATQVMRAVGTDDPQIQWARDVIERQARLMSRLVDDLMDVSRISRGMVELRKQRVDLNTVLTAALETARPLIDARRHEVHLSLPQTAVPMLADATRLEQVFANLLNNAAKYTPERGSIDLSLTLEGGVAVAVVRDSGVGIERDALPHVFDMFVQSGGDRSGARGGLGGLGIGLSLVRTLVRMHGGSVEVRSAGRGQGSEFTVRLPGVELPTGERGRPQDSAEPATPTIKTLPHAGAGVAGVPHRHILVVDDNHDVAETLAVFLRLQGQTVSVAHDASAAMAAFTRDRPEIVFLDIGMPEVDGHEVARRMRAFENGCAGDADADAGGDDTQREPARLVALTGWGQPADLRRSREAGFDDHLVKPVEPERLLEIVREGRPSDARRSDRPVMSA
jgi:PAS domain S-box-containing protein